jgi:uncharacterized membrane protein (DUF106 family)
MLYFLLGIVIGIVLSVLSGTLISNSLLKENETMRRDNKLLRRRVELFEKEKKLQRLRQKKRYFINK